MDARTRRLVLLLLAALLVTAGCDDASPADADDDDTTEEPGPSCEDGYVLDPDLPDEFLEDFPDGCVPMACGVGRWGSLEVDDGTVYVDAHAAEGGDGSEDTPFTSIQIGLDAAGDDGGRVVVAAGTYFENLLLTEDHDGVHLAGRCQELVVLDASEGEEDESGIRADGFMGDEDWWVSGITVTGAPYGGVWLDVGRLNVAGFLLVGNRQYGVFAWHSSSSLVLSNVEVLDSLPMADGTWGRGICVQDGASLRAEDCRVEGNAEIGIAAGHGGTTVYLSNVEVLDTQPLADGTLGRGIQVSQGASLQAEDCQVVGNVEVGIAAGHEGTTVHLSNVEVRETYRATEYTAAMGLSCQERGHLTASDVVVNQTEGPGLFATSGGTMSCTGCDLSDNAFAGALVWGGGILDLSDTTISGTIPDANEGGGFGIYASDRGAMVQPTSLLLDNTTIENQPYAAVWLDGDGEYSIRNSTLGGGYGEVIEHFDGSTNTLHGDGVVAMNGVERLWLENNVIQDAIRAGVLLDGSSAQLSGNSYTNNATDLVWQDCEGVEEPIGLDEVPDYDDRCSASTLPVAPLEFNLFLEDAEIAE